MNIIIKIPPRVGRWASSSRASHTRSGVKSSSKFHSTPVWVDGKVVGGVRGDVFIKSVMRENHFFWKYDGYSLNVESLEQAERAGASHIEIRETDTGDIYKVSMLIMWQKGIRLPDRGYGCQICLPIKYWTKSHDITWTQLSFEW